MYKTCVVCGKEFDALNSAKCCSPECIRAHQNVGQRARGRRRRAEHPERVHEEARKWRAKNPEKVREASREWYEAHQEKVSRRGRAWRKTPRGKACIVAVSHNRRTSLSGISMTADTVLDLKSEYAGFCPYCGTKIVKGHVDHIVPVSKGGTNGRTNLAWVCRSCNVQKGNRSLLTFLLQRQGGL